MQPDQPDNQKNILLAIILSMGVLLGWQMFYAGPKLKEEQARIKAKQEQTASQPGAPLPAGGSTATGVAPPAAPSAAPGATTAPTAAPAGAAGLNRVDALKQSARVAIDTPSLAGSISLKGGRIDDLTLVKHHETVDPKSPQVVLFSPLGAPNAYFAEHGWLNVPGSDHRLPNSDTVWASGGAAQLKPGALVTLSWDNGQGLLFKRTFSVDENYLFTLTDRVENKTGGEVALSPYARIYRFGVPKVEGFYIQHEGLIGVVGSEGLKEYTYAEAQKENMSKAFANQTGGWIGITDKYWAAALVPPQNLAFTGSFQGRKPEGVREALFFVDYALLPVKAAAGGVIEVPSHMYAGAKQPNLVEGYQDSLKIKQFDLMIDWGWFYFITKPLYNLMKWLHHYIGNFGFTILALTLLVKLAFFPLANKAYESMAKMKKLQPQMEQLRERFKDDKARQQQELMGLYQKEKINPLAGCLPILLQIPVFFALYKVLFISIDMRHAPFIGWIKDLSAPDPTSFVNLFGLLPFASPDFLHIGAWPLFMGVTMWFQMQLNPKQPDPTQQMIFNWMPVIFTFMLGGFASGLVIYWAWNNVLSLAQQSYIMKKQGTEIPLMDNLKSAIAPIKRLFGGGKA